MFDIYHSSKGGNNELPYERVACIHTDSLHKAFSDTQNIENAWHPESKRSTSSGDVLHDLINDQYYFLVPMGNGRHGEKIYETWGDTVLIENFNINGFIYDEVIS
tara:strand:+ start:459 stop:773 length:315 start_codon:yes stop_codon:yes gene_type:complete